MERQFVFCSWEKLQQDWKVILSDCVCMIFLNMIVEPLIAVIADSTSPKYRGTIQVFMHLV
ncbi:hypothetical protein FD16_GL001862 [Paucilactobacillus suebicus DSM 5007 = KCTC 3549]|uniref:Uncharacterized protein n=1 Tax=Paucilactobacillus suebicus DSM 5007 = KCTC 3549 TaxID=1423807 RepID=A0A0R1W437_9LACO|nr:hypothetical protein FD16_GL001862 [Paucilactobacillus suebicus DSM 5007 = KCTC 3549]